MNTVQMEIKKSSHALDVIFKILQVATYVGLGIVAASLIYLLCGGVDNPHIHSGLAIGGVTIDSMDALLPHLPELGSLVVWMALLLVIFYRIGGMFHDIQESGCPFTAKNAERMRFSSYVLAAAALLPNAAATILDITVSKSDYNVELINFGMLAIALVVWSLSKIFTYGVQLQQQDDETL